MGEEANDTADTGTQPTGSTVPELARRWRVGPDKIRTWIRKGELVAINTATILRGKPRWVVSPDAVAEFEKRRKSGPPPEKPKRRRLQRPVGFVDYFPD